MAEAWQRNLNHSARKDSLKIEFFLTVFDTRRYNWFKNIHLDTKEDTESVQEYKNIYLGKNHIHTIRTVSDRFHDGLQWAVKLENDFERQIQALEPGYAFTSLQDSSTLFTLPDFYMQTIDNENLKRIFTTNSVSKSEKEDVDLQRIKQYAWWLHFRARSKFLEFNNRTLAEDPFLVFDDSFLAAIMTNITRTLKPSASEYMKGSCKLSVLTRSSLLPESLTSRLPLHPYTFFTLSFSFF
jgi:hypothetical protein